MTLKALQTTKAMTLFVSMLGFVAMASPAAAQQATAALSVVSYGPTGEVANLQQSNEIRIVFSEQMVVLGRIPQPVRAPFVTITPAINGQFRWSGTTILIFTPDPRNKLPFDPVLPRAPES